MAQRTGDAWKNANRLTNQSTDRYRGPSGILSPVYSIDNQEDEQKDGQEQMSIEGEGQKRRERKEGRERKKSRGRKQGSRERREKKDHFSS